MAGTVIRERASKSLGRTLSSPGGLEFLSHPTQRSASGCTLGYTESPLRGWLLVGSNRDRAFRLSSHTDSEALDLFYSLLECVSSCLARCLPPSRKGSERMGHPRFKVGKKLSILN